MALRLCVRRTAGTTYTAATQRGTIPVTALHEHAFPSHCARRCQSTQSSETKEAHAAPRASLHKALPKRKGARASGAASAGQRPGQAPRSRTRTPDEHTKNVAAYCAAEEYQMGKVARVLSRSGYVLDPYGTALSPQVVHFQMPAASTAEVASGEAQMHRMGDVFVFPSGTVVAWDVHDGRIQSLVSGALQEAAVNPHPDRLETEDLDYYEDSTLEKSAVVGDTLRIGTRANNDADKDSPEPRDSGLFESKGLPRESHETDLALTKIAFSSALARSTKVAVLESLLDSYFTSTQSLPSLLSTGSRLPRHYNRRFILRKTGELLSVRAQLNLTELTDRTPDLFWETRHELGLEGYFEQASRALDLNWRIKVLNERVDYAREIAEVLREELQGRHGEMLEWLIISLIAVEVGFEGWKLLREWREGESTEQLTRRYLKMKMGEPLK